MRVVIFGASGMVGMGVLLECLDDPRVESVLVIGRSTCGVTHPKLTELLHRDFFNFEAIESRFANLDACFFCLGVSSVGMKEDAYRHLTYDLTLVAATTLAAVSPQLTFCYVSGQGTDGTGNGRVMWARVKGQTENALMRLPFKEVYALRPGFIQPMRGVRSKTAVYQAVYSVLAPVTSLFPRLFPAFATTTVATERAMIHLAAAGDAARVLENADINRVAAISGIPR